MAAERDDAGVYIGPSEKTITLRTPITAKGGEAIHSVTLQEPTAKQLSQYFAKLNSTNDSGIEASALLISLCSGLIPPDVESLKQRDFDACGDFLAVFTKAPPQSAGAK